MFTRFFPWVWTSVVTLLATGFGMVLLFFGWSAAVQPFVHIMRDLGPLMTAIYVYLYFVRWQAYAQAVAAQDWKLAPLGAGGRFWG